MEVRNGHAGRARLLDVDKTAEALSRPFVQRANILLDVAWRKAITISKDRHQPLHDALNVYSHLAILMNTPRHQVRLLDVEEAYDEVGRSLDGTPAEEIAHQIEDYRIHDLGYPDRDEL